MAVLPASSALVHDVAPADAWRRGRRRLGSLLLRSGRRFGGWGLTGVRSWSSGSRRRSGLGGRGCGRRRRPALRTFARWCWVRGCGRRRVVRLWRALRRAAPDLAPPPCPVVEGNSARGTRACSASRGRSGCAAGCAPPRVCKALAGGAAEVGRLLDRQHVGGADVVLRLGAEVEVESDRLAQVRLQMPSDRVAGDPADHLADQKALGVGVVAVRLAGRPPRRLLGERRRHQAPIEHRPGAAAVGGWRRVRSGGSVSQRKGMPALPRCANSGQ